MPFSLQIPFADGAEPRLRHIREKSQPCGKAWVYVKPINTRKAACLSLGRGKKAALLKLRNTLQPPTARGFSLRRPQRDVKRAVQNARRRNLEIRKE